MRDMMRKERTRLQFIVNSGYMMGKTAYGIGDSLISE